MWNDLNFDTHIILPQPGNSDASPKRLVVGHILLEVPNHGRHRLIVDRDVVGVHSEHLRPPISTSIFQIQLNILKCLVDLCIYLLIELSCNGIPAAFQ